MSQQNIEVVRRFYEFWDTRDYDAIADLVHPDVEVDVMRNIFNPGIHRGLDGFRRLVEQVDEVWERIEFVPSEVIDAGDSVVVANQMTARGSGSGVEVGMRLYGVVQFREGKVQRFVGGFRERSEALKFAGIEE